MYPKRERNSWYCMKRRCYYEKDIGYHNYGGRGIKVCDRWLGENGFKNFFEDMGPRPKGKYSLDRINNDLDYCKENCRWGTKKDQDRNRRTNRIIEHNNEKLIMIEWAEKLGMTEACLKNRLDSGWLMEKVINTPIKNIGIKHKRDSLIFNGQILSIHNWSKKLNISRSTLYNRMNRGWSDEKILTTPVRKIKKRKNANNSNSHS